MDNHFKYLTTSSEDRDWGLYLNVAGNAKIKNQSIYPSPEHPSEYFFSWEQGRILNEFQVNYITEGNGILESKYGKFPLLPGSVFIIFPGEWHRYRPSIKTGWIENYIGFEGKIAIELFKLNHFTPKNPIYNVGIKEEILDTYLKIFDLIEKEFPGYQQIASGLILKLLGYIIAFEKQKGFSGKSIAKVIESARFEMRNKMNQEIDLEELAKKHNVGYSYFRKMFKKYTGVSPGQYHLQLRLMRAKELLAASDKTIKEISFELGFQSIYYFSSLFKKKEKITPSQFRNKNEGFSK